MIHRDLTDPDMTRPAAANDDLALSSFRVQ
jgi:hypothetical protein